MTDHRKLSIVVTMLVSFSLSFAYLYWQRRPNEMAVAALLPPIAPNSRPVLPEAQRMGRMPQPAPILETRSSMPMPQQREPGPEAPQSSDAGPLPVAVLVRNQFGHQQGLIRNKGPEDLQLTITEVSPESGATSQILMTLGRDEHKTFSADDGLQMNRGDKLIVHATGFSDRESHIQ